MIQYFFKVIPSNIFSQSILTIFLLWVCNTSWAQTPSVTFTDITEESGIDFRYTFGDTTYGNILESSGSGVSVFDYDGDGDLDLYMLNGTFLEGISDPEGVVFKDTPNQLYQNNGDGTFTDVTQKAGVGDVHWSMAAGALDYDNDGDVDIYLLNYGPNVFYINNNDGTFTDVTDSLGLRGPKSLNGFTKWSVGVAFWDYNLDGAIDMMVGNFLAFDPKYVSSTMPDMMPHPAEYHGQASMLYHQNKNGSFTDVTKAMGLYYPESKCMGLTVFDYDDDGDLDLFQGNDHQMNFLFRNDGQNNFQEVAQISGVAVNDQGLQTGSMHGSIGDIDGDGLIDLLVTDLRHGSLYRNLGSSLFEDITEQSGLARLFTGKGVWAAAFFDFDNDGDLDVFSANGVAEELTAQYPLLAENDGYGHFTNIGPEHGPYFREKRSGRGAAVWDYDNDGDLDIIISHIDLRATATLLRNDIKNNNHWLGLTLIGKNGPASALGAKVTIYIGEKRIVTTNQYATSYLSSNDPRMHFGLGDHHQVDRLEIDWPDQHTDIFHDIKADRYLTAIQNKGLR
jgi:hypothetical protein